MKDCDFYPSDSENRPTYCSMSNTARFEELSGGWGGFNQSLTVAALEPDRLSNEVLSFAMWVRATVRRVSLTIGSSNGAQFIYSLLYLMMIYNITLVSQVCQEL
jgi:hypothetical protein